MIYHLFIHKDAKDDLELLWSSDSTAAAQITVFFEELDENQDLLDRLTQHDFGHSRGSAQLSVSKWQSLWNRGFDIWRLKLWDLENIGIQLRIIYAYIPIKNNYHILAIAPRSFNYDEKDPISERIITAYSGLL